MDFSNELAGHAPFAGRLVTDLQLEQNDDLRCSVQTASLGEVPAGSAGFAERVLLVELPLPWPNKIDQHELLHGLDLGSDQNVKLLGIGTGEQPGEQHRVICWERTEPFRGYEATETSVPRSELIGVIASLAHVGPAATEQLSPVDSEIQDLLICTHGTRDRCCGQFGTRLFSELDGAFGPEVRVWRTSHTGGHRFSPTGILFPYGTTWAGLDAELTVAIVEKTIATGELAAHHRGNLGVSGRPQQLAESATFLARGWSWLESARNVEIGGENTSNEDTVVAVVSSADHTATITMESRPPVPVPACGEPLDAATKATPQFHIV